MGLLDQGKGFATNFLRNKLDEAQVIAKQPVESARRALLGVAADKLSKNKSSRRVANTLQDLEDLRENGDKIMSRRKFIDLAFQRSVGRRIPEVINQVDPRIPPSSKGNLKYAPMQRVVDVRDNVPGFTELDSRKAVRKAAKEAEERWENTQATLDMLEYSYMGNITQF